MARRRRKARVVKPVEVEVEEVLEEEFLDEEEVVEPKPKTRRRRKNVVEPEPEEEEYDDEDEEPEPAPKPKPRRRKKVVKPEPEPEPEVAAVSDLDVFYGLLENLDDGALLTITRTGEDTWTVSGGDAVAIEPAVQKLRGRAYYDEVQSDEFITHKLEWKELTFSEKKAHAKKIKAVWDPHDDSRVEVMRITTSVRKKLGIEKYKPQYRSRAARAAIRG